MGVREVIGRRHPQSHIVIRRTTSMDSKYQKAGRYIENKGRSGAREASAARFAYAANSDDML